MSRRHCATPRRPPTRPPAANARAEFRVRQRGAHRDRDRERYPVGLFRPRRRRRDLADATARGDGITHLVGAPQRDREGRGEQVDRLPCHDAVRRALRVSAARLGRSRRAAYSTRNSSISIGKARSARRDGDGPLVDRDTQPAQRPPQSSYRRRYFGDIGGPRHHRSQAQQHERQRGDPQEIQQPAESDRSSGQVRRSGCRPRTPRTPPPSTNKIHNQCGTLRQRAARNVRDSDRRQHQRGDQADGDPARIERQQDRDAADRQQFGAGPQIVHGRGTGHRAQQHDRARRPRSDRSSGGAVVMPLPLPPSRPACSTPPRRSNVCGQRPSRPAKSCDITTTVRPCSRRNSSSRRTRPLWVTASSPASGSSRISALGERASRPASTTRRIWPPLSWSMRRSTKPLSKPDDAERSGHAFVVLGRKARGRSHFPVDPTAHQLQSGRLKRQCNRADLFVDGRPSRRQLPVSGPSTRRESMRALTFPSRCRHGEANRRPGVPRS